MDYILYYKLVSRNKIYELLLEKNEKKKLYMIEPSCKLYIEILNLRRQVNSLNVKLKKKGKSKLRNEL